MSTTQVCGFLKKKHKLFATYTCEKGESSRTFWGGESFEDAFWKNKVGGTQNFDISWKSAFDVAKSTIKNRKYHENPIDSKIWSRYPNEARSSAKII